MIVYICLILLAFSDIWLNITIIKMKKEISNVIIIRKEIKERKD